MHQAAAPPDEPAALDPSDWEGPARREAVPGTAPVLAIDGFEGPLDWLLELARARQIDLARLSIAALVDAFAAALTAALADLDPSATTLARWSDWLVMAADLILLRSRLLLPSPPAEARDTRDAAETLRRRLLARARRVPARSGRGHHRRQGRAGRRRHRAAARIRALLPAIGEGGVALGALLPGLPADVSDRDRDQRCREAVASTFGAGLEMARGGDLTLDQEAAWAPIQVRRGQHPRSDTGGLAA